MRFEPLPAEGWITALAGLPRLAPARFRRMLESQEPAEAWAELAVGRFERHQLSDSMRTAWSRYVYATDPRRLWADHLEQGVQVLPYASPGYPSRLLDDPEPPVALFAGGDLDLLERRSVSVVGTRRCTRYGRDVAHELGAALASAGLAVVSGLALGIDAAAHAGALGVDHGAAVGVVAGGIDSVYPRANRGLFEQVRARGLLVSELPLGARPERWRFPARNRVVAALSEVTVVVESRARGGSLYTVDEALRRDRTVFAVPGPIRSPASLGTNRLIADGAQPLCVVADLTDYLVGRDAPSAARGGAAAPPVAPAGDAATVFDHIGWTPVAIDDLVAATDLSAGAVALAVEQLVEVALVHVRAGWVERIHRAGSP